MYTQQEFEQIAEGMEVYDRDGAQVGTVKAFRLGEGTVRAQATDVVTKAEIVLEALGRKNNNLPTVLYERLYTEGFVSVGRGFLRRDVIVFPDQIEQIVDGAIYLTVDADELPSI